MGHMKLQTLHGLWIVYDGRCGGGVIEADLVSDELESGDELSYDEKYEMLKFTEERSVEAIFDARVELGWCSRYSAPGFMDHTDWCGPFDSQEEAEEEARRMYGAE